MNSIKDPRPLLREIIRRAADGHMPSKAKYWATKALETAESIYDSIDEMEEREVEDVPTEGQIRALNNIHRAACNWLRVDTDDCDS